MIYKPLQIYRPLISKKISQHFGENKACLRADGSVYGVAHKCPGMSFYESMGMKGHSGIDIPAWLGEEVYHAATFDGWFSAESDLDGGLGVDVISNEPIFFAMPIPTELIPTAVPVEGGFTHHVKMRYWHLKMPIGHNKKQIKCGMVIGLAGNTGASSGVHLHFAPKWCLPDGRGVGQSNGYVGAFDPTPYYNHEVTAADHAKYMNMPTVPLSPVEQKDIQAQLGIARQLLLSLQKLIHKI